MILAVALAAAATTAPAYGFASVYVGKTTNSHGTVRLTFTTQRVQNIVRLRVSSNLGRGRKVFKVECRASGEYESVVAFLGTYSGQRTFEGPGQLPAGARVCRVKRAGTVVATMRLHPA